MRSRDRLFTLSILAFTAWSASAADNWPEFRGPGGQGHADSGNLPVEWSESENIAWKTAIEGKAWSSPVVWGDRIWVTNANEEGTKLSVVCLDKQDGSKIYDRELCTVKEPQFCHDFNSYASPTPALEDGFVYLSFGSPYTACIEQSTGKVIWERKDFVCNHFRGAGSSPIIYQNLVMLHFDGSDHQFVVAMNKKTGETVWRTERSVDYDDLDKASGKPKRDGDFRKGYATPLIVNVDGRDLLVGPGSMALYAYAPLTGEELWRAETIGTHSSACRPLSGHGMVFATMGFSRGLLIAVRPDGSGDVTKSHIAWEYSRAAPEKPSILLDGDLIFMVDDGGIAACVEAKTGKEVWRDRIGGNFSASPILANGKIYLFDEQGKTTVIEAGRELKVLAENTLDAGFMSSPAVSGDLLIVRTRTHLYGIRK